MPWDSMAVMTFRDEKHAFTFSGIMKNPVNAKKIHDDEVLFMNVAGGSPQMVVVGTDWTVTVPK
jgi:hypothetical protein